MALNVKIYELTHPTDVGCNFLLAVDTVEHSVTRMPVLVALPGSSRLFLDLGMSMETITLTGTCLEYDSTATNVDKIKLRNAVINWYASGTSAGGLPAVGLIVFPGVSIDQYETYTGTFESVNFRNEAAKDFVTFTLVFAVYNKIAGS